jgi:hypothetical protein
VLKNLTQIGHFSDWLGLVNGYSLRKLADKACLWGCTDEFWDEKALLAAIEPFREYAVKQGLSDETIDKELQYFKDKTGVSLNEIRRAYYQIEIEPKEKLPNLEALAKEAEDALESEPKPELSDL